MGVLRTLGVAALFAAACTPASALYFYVTDGTQRCFIEEVPSDTLIVGTYKNPDFAAFGTPGFMGVGVAVTVHDPNKETMLEKNLEREGRFSFTSHAGGEYHVCFGLNGTRAFGATRPRFRVDLALDVGETGIDYAEVARKEHLSDLEVEVRRLNDKLKDVMKEQQYQREREALFRAATESTHTKVQWFSIAQTLVMIAAGVWQITHLKSFFSRKKIA